MRTKKRILFHGEANTYENGYCVTLRSQLAIQNKLCTLPIVNKAKSICILISSQKYKRLKIALLNPARLGRRTSLPSEKRTPNTRS